MSDIERRIGEKKKAGVLREKDIKEIEMMELEAYPDFQDVPHVFESHLYTPEKLDHSHFNPEAEGEKGILKKVLGKIRSLLAPLLRFMLRPHLKEFVWFNELNKHYIQLLHNSTHNLIMELTKLKIEEETLKTRVKTLEDRLEFIEKRQRFIEKNVEK
jgi:hypothetical protein